jgi:aquaporin TIP
LNRLPNLQTLIFSNTSLETLPKNIGCLQKLQYFDLSGCVNLRELPTSKCCTLPKLVKLH